MSEKLIWKGSPSQWLNIKTYLSCIFIFPLPVAFARFFKLKSHKITITDQRIIEEKGVFSKITDELELFRVKDIRFEQPFWFRMTGLANISLLTSDKTHPELNLYAIKKGKDIKEKLRLAIDIRRDQKGVSEVDF